MKLCEIYNNKAWWIFEADTMPEFATNIVIKDITDLKPQPQEGWNYDSNTDTFTAPAINQVQQTDLSQQVETLQSQNAQMLLALVNGGLM